MLWAARRITNRESARRMRLKRHDDWEYYKNQVSSGLVQSWLHQYTQDTVVKAKPVFACGPFARKGNKVDVCGSDLCSSLVNKCFDGTSTLGNSILYAYGDMYPPLSLP